MRSISRRIRRLEETFEPPVETEYTLRLRERIEAGRRRLAQWREQEGISVSDQDRENLAALSVTINGGAIIDHEAPLKRRFVAVQK